MRNIEHIASALSNQTGDQWIVTENANPGRAYILRMSDDLEILFRVKRNCGIFDEPNANQQIEIGGVALKYANGSYFGWTEQPSIGVNIDRDPQVIAKDIRKRFLPAYEKWLKEAKAEIAIQDGRTMQRKMTADLIQHTFGALYSSHSDRVHKWYHGAGSWEVQVATDGINKLTFTNLDPETAMDMIQIFEESQRQNQKSIVPKK